MMLQLVARQIRCTFLGRLLQVILLHFSVCYYVHNAKAEPQLIANGHFQAEVLSNFQLSRPCYI